MSFAAFRGGASQHPACMMNVRCYRVWTPEEEEALRQGVQKHGIGSWEIIRQDTSFSNLLWWAIGGLCLPTASLHRVHGRHRAHNYGPLGFFDVHQKFSHEALRRSIRAKSAPTCVPDI